MDEPKRKYEISFIVKKEEDREEAVKILSRHGGEIFDNGAVSRIKLSYPIAKENFGYFSHLYFSAAPENISEMDKELQTASQVLRFLIISFSEKKAVPPRRDISRSATRQREGGRGGVAAAPAAYGEKEPMKSRERPIQDEYKQRAQLVPEGELSNEALEKKLEEILK